MTAIEVLRRMASVTGSPHYGGIDPDDVGESGFSLPGGGMSCRKNGNNVQINVHSIGGVVRLRAELDCRTMELIDLSNVYDIHGHRFDIDGRYVDMIGSRKTGQPPTPFVGWDPRPRDWERLFEWIQIARGQEDRIPWHGRPADATDDPVAVALEYRRRYSTMSQSAVYDWDLLRHMLPGGWPTPNYGPHFSAVCADMVLGRIVVRDDAHKHMLLVDALLEDRAAALSSVGSTDD